MGKMTVEQAIEWGKTLSFEKVWAMFAETDQKFVEAAEQFKEIGRKQAENAEQSKKTDEQLKELGRKQAENAEQMKKTDEQIKALSANIGGVSRTLGKWSEEMVAANICKKMNPFGYEFTESIRNKRYWENGKKIAEVDCLLENGGFVMPVETKSELTVEDVDEHLERIAKLRLIMDKRDDKRIIVGAVAGAVVPENVCNYAQKKGLYVLVQSGESVVVAEMPENFKARKWNGVRTNGI
jgi:hypothetical protein